MQAPILHGGPVAHRGHAEIGGFAIPHNQLLDRLSAVKHSRCTPGNNVQGRPIGNQQISFVAKSVVPCKPRFRQQSADFGSVAPVKEHASGGVRACRCNTCIPHECLKVPRGNCVVRIFRDDNLDAARDLHVALCPGLTRLRNEKQWPLCECASGQDGAEHKGSRSNNSCHDWTAPVKWRLTDSRVNDKLSRCTPAFRKEWSYSSADPANRCPGSSPAAPPYVGVGEAVEVFGVGRIEYRRRGNKPDTWRHRCASRSGTHCPRNSVSRNWHMAGVFRPVLYRGLAHRLGAAQVAKKGTAPRFGAGNRPPSSVASVNCDPLYLRLATSGPNRVRSSPRADAHLRYRQRHQLRALGCNFFIPGHDLWRRSASGAALPRALRRASRCGCDSPGWHPDFP